MKILPANGILIRGSDPFGSGAWMAPRDGGHRRHMGIDICVWPGTPICSPITGHVEREAKPYASDPYFSGLLIQSRESPEVAVKMFYVQPEPGVIGRHVFAGDRVGHAQDIRKKYHEITPHYHLELWIAGKRVDPTPYLGGAELA